MEQNEILVEPRVHGWRITVASVSKSAGSPPQRPNAVRHEGDGRIRSRWLLQIAVLAVTLPRVAGASDALFVHGSILTEDTSNPRASAILVRGEKIEYVGDDTSARARARIGVRIVDLQGGTVLPGFQDSHVHPSAAPGPDTLDLNGVTDRNQVVSKIHGYAEAHREKTWIVGTGWDEAAFLPSGQPTRDLLDQAVPDRPAYLDDNAGHEAWVNSRALALARITSDTPNPPNGRIEKDGTGQPTGVLQEDAMDLVTAVIPKPTVEELTQTLAYTLSEMTRLGITALVDADATTDVARAYEALAKDGRLNQHVTLCQHFKTDQADEPQIKEFIERSQRLSRLDLRANCVKLFLDGAYGSHTVVLLDPYSDEPARFGRGKLFIDPERLNRIVTRLDAAGIKVHFHAQGDGAVRAALDAIEAARNTNGPRDNRHTIAHLCLIDPQDIPRFKELGAVANMTPLWMLRDTWEAVFAPRLFGETRAERLYPVKSLLRSGAVVVWGTDWPVTWVSPIDGLETAVSHRYPGGRDPQGRVDQPLNPRERVTIAQAVYAYTTAGAYLTKDEAIRGQLRRGALADLVILDRDLLTTPVMEIHDARIDLTMFKGKVVYERSMARVSEARQ